MKHDVLQELLSGSEGVKAESTKGEKKDSAGFLLDPTMEATLYAGVGTEMLSVAKIVFLRVNERYVLAETQRGDRFFLEADSIKGLKLERLSEARRERAPGFSR